MLSKCANPECPTPFHYLREGKLFQVERGSRPQIVSGKRPPRKVEYFWLCGKCATTMTLALRGQGVVTVPLPETSPRRAAAS